MAAQTEDKKLDGAGLSVLWGLIKNIIPTVPTNVSSFTNDAAYVSLLDTHNANLVLASPNGASGLPSFRALAASDIPDLSGTYLTSASLNGYATQSWVTSQGFGTVSSINIGTTSYSPSSGVVSLPAYPTTLPASDVYSWAKQSTKPSYSWSEIGSRPTKLSEFTNDSGFITGITSSMVTTALGFTPANSTSLSSYLPLNGDDTYYLKVLTGGNKAVLVDNIMKGQAAAAVKDVACFLNRPQQYYQGAQGNGLGAIIRFGSSASKCGALKYVGVDNWNNHAKVSILTIGSNYNIEAITILHTGSVGIAQTEPSYKLHVGGDVGATAFTNTSDIRNKDFVSNLTMSIEQIANAPSFKFRWKTGDDRNVHAGSSAQYWNMVLPEVVTAAQDEQHTLSMQYDVIALLSAITIAKEVVSDKERIRQLEQRVSQLEAQLAN